MNRESFILYTIHKSAWMSLSNDDAGLLIKAILDYQTGDPVSLPPIPNAFFTMIKAYLDRDAAKWEQTVEKRRQAGAKGGVASGRSRRKQAKQEQANEANASLAKQTKQTQANEANQANPSCIDVSCYVYEDQDSSIEKKSHTQKRYEAQGVRVPPAPLNGEDIAERQDAFRAQQKRGQYEFHVLRDAYDRVKPEAPQAGFPEFLRLYNSPEWRSDSLDEILAGLDALAKGDRQFLGEERYRPGLAKFLAQGMWRMKPRSPEGAEPELTDAEKATKAKADRMLAELKAKEAAKKKIRGW